MFTHGGVMSFCLPRMGRNVRNDLAAQHFLPNCAVAEISIDADDVTVHVLAGQRGPLGRLNRAPLSEEAVLAVVDALEVVVVEDDAAYAAVLGERARLRLDLLRGEDAGDRGEVRVAVHQLEVAGELLDAVDVAAALDLDGDGRAAASLQRMSTGPMGVMYSRRVSV